MIRGKATTPANNRVPGQIKFYCDDGSSLNETVRITRYGRTQVSKEFAIRNSAGYGNGRNSRVEYIQGGSGTYSTCTVTIDQNSFGSTVYDIQVHGYSSSTAHVAGGYYQNSSIYNDSKSINHATSGVSVTGPTNLLEVRQQPLSSQELVDGFIQFAAYLFQQVAMGLLMTTT